VTRGVPISPDSQRLLAAALFELVHQRTPERERLGVLAGLREEAVGEALTELVRVGAVVLDGESRLVAAYPLSAVPTAHTVELESSAPWANCVIDALAVPMMVGQRGHVVSKCAHCDAPVRTTVEGQAVLDVEPAGAVVAYGRLANCSDRPSLEVSCPYINFFCSVDHAAAWQRPQTWQGRIVPVREALLLAVEAFRPIIEIYAALKNRRGAAHGSV
jgi:hypothetical protein